MKGFGLIEAIVTIGIIAILLGISLIRIAPSAFSNVATEATANEIVSTLRLAQRLAIANNQRYDVVFVFHPGAAPDAPREYYIQNANTGEIYRNEIHRIRRRVRVGWVSSTVENGEFVQLPIKYAFLSDGSCHVFDALDRYITPGSFVAGDPPGAGINLGAGFTETGDRGGKRYGIRCVRSTGRVYADTLAFVP